MFFAPLQKTEKYAIIHTSQKGERKGKAMKEKTTPAAAKPRKKKYRLSRAALMQRRDANRKSAAVRKTSYKWRTAAITEDNHEWAVTRYGSVNEAVRALRRQSSKGKEVG